MIALLRLRFNALSAHFCILGCPDSYETGCTLYSTVQYMEQLKPQYVE